jgi:hypothetical protein
MCPCYSCQNPPRRSVVGRLFSLVVSLVLVYAGALLVSGTLINTGHPLAIEVGELIQVVTFVEPTIYWADSHEMDSVAKGLRLLAGGLPINQIA